MVDFTSRLDILKYLVNKEIEEMIFTGIISSINPLQVKFTSTDDPINAIPLNIIGAKIGSNVFMMKYLNKFAVIGVVGTAIQAKCSLIKNSAQTLAHNSTDKITFGTGDVDYDPSSMFDDTNNRIIVPNAGLYEISMSGRWVTGGAGTDRAVYIDVGHSGESASRVYADMRSVGSTGRGGNSATIKKYLDANDYIEMFCWQFSGGNLDFGGSGFYNVYFSVVKCL